MYRERRPYSGENMTSVTSSYYTKLVEILKNDPVKLCALMKDACEKNKAVPWGILKLFLERSRGKKALTGAYVIDDDTPVSIGDFCITVEEIEVLRKNPSNNRRGFVIIPKNN